MTGRIETMSDRGTEPASGSSKQPDQLRRLELRRAGGP
jgi:hypothetical protein